MTQLPALPGPSLQDEVAALAEALRRANGPVMALLNRLAGSAERQAMLLPAPLRRRAEEVTRRALMAGHGLARAGERVSARRTMIAAVTTGAGGGLGGLGTALAELPVTVTLILAAIRQEAVAAGFDPEQEGVRAACLQVFAMGSPVPGDDGINTAFLTARLTLTGPALQKLIASIAPRLAAALGQKVMAQAVPLLGAVSGAAVNAAYLRYYRELARIRFQLMRLSVQHGGEEVLAAFGAATGAPAITRSDAAP